MHCRRWRAFQPRCHTTILRLTALSLLVTLAGALLLPTPVAAAGSRYFPETGHNSPDIFANYWAAYGGVERFGLPITEPYLDNGLTIQWFERARFERHPENKDTPFEVQLGQLGREMRLADAPVAPTNAANSRYFMDTGHNVALFLPYWKANGDMAGLGQPLTEEIREKNAADNKVYTVQYFERARLEYHPERKGTPGEVQLGLLGQEQYNILKQRNPVAAAAGQAVTPPIAAAAPAPNGEAIEMQMWRAINAYRATRGVAPLAYDPLIAKAAAIQVNDMVTNDFLEHTGSDGSRPIDRMRRAGAQVQWVSENIAMECAKDPATAVKNIQAWMIAEPYADGVYNHHWNILYSGYSRIGISFGVGKNGCWVMSENFADGDPASGSITK